MRRSCCLACPEGNDRHGGGEGDFDCGGEHATVRQHIHQARRQGSIFQAEIFRADFCSALHGRAVAVFLGETAVFHSQFDLVFCGKEDFQHGFIKFLIAAYGEGHADPVGLDGGHGVSGVDAESGGLLLTGGVLELEGGSAGHCTQSGVGEYLGRAAGAENIFQIRQLQKGRNGFIGVAVVNQRLCDADRHRQGKEECGSRRTVYPPHTAGQGAQDSFSVLSDAEPGKGPDAGESCQPGKAHVGG